MEEARKISDMMAVKAAEYGQQVMKGNGILAERLVGQYPMSATSDYSFCPRCAERKKTAYGREWKAHLRPLNSLRYKILLKVSEGIGRIAYETRWNCPECKKTVTEEDFIEVYCATKAEKSPFVDLTKNDPNSPSFVF